MDTAGNFSESNKGTFAEEFEKLINEKKVDKIRQGRVTTGTIVAVNKDFVSVDIGFKSEGVVPLNQFQQSDGSIKVKKGDTVDVLVLALENEFGQLVLSKEKADQKRVWEHVEEVFKNDSLLSGKIMLKVKGGLQVDIGIPAFLPGSQIDVRPHRNLDKFLGEVWDFKVLKITRDKGNIVLSRRAVLLSERDKQRTATLKVISEGVVVEGTVKNVTEYGAFIDLGGIDGLLHITDITWGRVNHPSEKLTVGQVVPVVVLKYDQEKERVSLGMKQLKEDPWLTVHERYPIGGRTTGKVVSLAEYGAFVEIEDGVEGLIHVSEMSWTKKVRHPSKVVSEGDKVEAVIIGIDAQERRISLGLKQLTPNPWEDLLSRHPKGSRVKGKIRSITEFGIFIGVEDGIDGLVHVSDFSWIKRIKDSKEISALYKKGDEVEAIVLDVDVDNERLSLGIKQLENDPWETIPQRYPVGSKVKGKIAYIEEFGIFVEIEEGVEGLIHSSHLGLEKGTNISEFFSKDQIVECEVIGVNRDDRKINLSIKALNKRRDSEEFAQYIDSDSNSEQGSMNFGELLERAMGNKDEE